MNRRVGGIPESVTLQIADRARSLQNEGRTIVQLQTGDPDFATPEPVVEAALTAMRSGLTHYGPTRGLPALREALAAKFSSTNRIDYCAADEILVTHGGVHAVYCAIQALLNPGDRALIFDPCWMPYVSGVLLAGGEPVRIATRKEDGFALRADWIPPNAVERARLLILNSPCNPSGRIWSRDELLKIAERVQRHDFFVIADEVYEELLYDEVEHISFASLPGMRERTVTINSFSKTYAMTGWRIGYLGGPKRLVDAILKIAQYSITNVAPFLQQAAITALTDRDVRTRVEEMKSEYALRRELVMQELAGIGVMQTMKPDGAFYLMIDVSKYADSSESFSLELLEKQGVAVVPGAGFGECAEGTVRITFATNRETLLAGIRGIRDFVADLQCD